MPSPRYGRTGPADGVGDITFFGARDYSMRIWLDPDKIAARNLTASDIVLALREQNVQVAAGVHRRSRRCRRVCLPMYDQHAQAGSPTRTSSATSWSRPARTAEITHLRDVGRVELGARDYTSEAISTASRL